MTTIPIPLIENPSQLDSCPKLPIDKFYWNTIYKPTAWAKLGCYKDKGLFVGLYCEESNPVRHCSNHFDKVYFDSALEAFFQFIPDCPLYFNFEFNANGAALVRYGHNRFDRSSISIEEIDQLNIETSIEENHWQLTFYIPFDLIQKYQPDFVPSKETPVYANFYKLSEAKEIEHYGSFADIDSPEPNFHLIQCFKAFQLS